MTANTIRQVRDEMIGFKELVWQEMNEQIVVEFHAPAPSIKARMSSTRHAVVRGPSFTDLGKRPSLTPAHQVERLTGMSAGMGGSALGFPMI